MLESEESRVSFPMAEALAFGTLALKRAKGREACGGIPQDDVAVGEKKGQGALEGLNLGSYSVRLSGQDVERGTFNQRHAVLYDQVTGERCVLPLPSTPETEAQPHTHARGEGRPHHSTCAHAQDKES